MPSIGRWAREIVAKRALVVVVVTALAHLAVARGWLTITDDQVQTWTERVVDLVGFLLAAGWIRGGVTPADPKLAPQTHDGRVLVPEGSALARPPLEPGARVTRGGTSTVRVFGDGSGEALPPLPESAYPPDARPLDSDG